MFVLFLPHRQLHNFYSSVDIQHCSCLPLVEEEDSDVDFEASRRSTRVQSKSTIRSALFLAKH